MKLATIKKKHLQIFKPEIDTINAEVSEEFKAEIMKQISHEIKQLLINLSGVEFMDSSGVNSLVAVLKETEKRKVSLALCEVRPPVETVFKLCGLSKVFNILSTEQEAVIHFKLKEDVLEPI